MKKYIVWWSLVLAAIGISLGFLWAHYEPYEETIEFGDELEKTLLKKGFPSVSRVGNSENIWIENLRRQGVVTEGARTHDATRELFMLVASQSSAKPLISTSVQIDKNGSGGIMGAHKVYVAPMEGPDNYVTYHKVYPLTPNNPSSWFLKDISFEKAVFEYDNNRRGQVWGMGHLTVENFMLAAYAILLGAIGHLIIAGFSNLKPKQRQGPPNPIPAPSDPPSDRV